MQTVSLKNWPIYYFIFKIQLHIKTADGSDTILKGAFPSFVQEEITIIIIIFIIITITHFIQGIPTWFTSIKTAIIQ